MSSLPSISILKQYRRLFKGPIDSTLTWNTLDELNEYLNSPVCYPNQIVGCEGKAYIIINENNINKLQEIGQVDNSGNITTTFGYYIGDTPPEDTNLIWFDTSEESFDSNINSDILNELKSVISYLKNKINYLEKEIEDLKNNTIIDNDYNDINEVILISEDGKILLSENNKVIINNKEIIKENYISIISENGEILLSEDNKEIISENRISSNQYINIISENELLLLSEDGKEIISETSLDELITEITTEDNLNIISENNEIIIKE